jgi:hypothetical protein
LAAFRFSSCLLLFVVPSVVFAALLLRPASVDAEAAVVVARVWFVPERYALPAADLAAEDSWLEEAEQDAQPAFRWSPVAPASRA